ncbi:MAG: nitrogen regulatory protein P-II 2 [Candidatus Latescibacterota bacterium]|jgi:nitrogen regulatory protein P-II 2
MNTVSLKLVTIIAERILKDRLTDAIRSLGAKGFTLTDVSGEGSRGVRASEWEGHNLKIETVVSSPVADAIVEHISERYFQHHAVIVYTQDIQVIRGEKYI